MKDHLVAKGAHPAELTEAGLLIAPEDGSTPYDRFRDRIIFPIADARGRVVSFGGRALDPAARAKYLNGPETPVFHKGAVLYGLSEARRLLHAAEARGAQVAGAAGAASLVVVEGYMDVIACQRANIAAVAHRWAPPSPKQQIELAMALLRPSPTLCLRRRRGRACARLGARMDRALPLLKPGRSLPLCLPSSAAKTPDDVLREQGAAGAPRPAQPTPSPFVAVLFEREKTEAEPISSTPETYARP